MPPIGQGYYQAIIEQKRRKMLGLDTPDVVDTPKSELPSTPNPQGPNIMDLLREADTGPAITALKAHANAFPQRQEPSNMNKILQVLAGSLAGYLGKDPITAGDAIRNGAYKQQVSDYQQQTEPLQTAAELEQAGFKNKIGILKEQGDQEREARMLAHSLAQEAAANARVNQGDQRLTDYEKGLTETNRHNQAMENKAATGANDISVHPADLQNAETGLTEHHMLGYDKHGNQVSDQNLGEKGNAQKTEKVRAAKAVIQAANNLKNMLPNIASKIGPGAGRYSNFQAWLGSGDADAQKYILARKFLADNHAQLFGAKNSERLMEHLEKSIGGAEQNINQSLGSFDAVINQAQETIDSGNPKSDAIEYVRDPVTHKLVKKVN